MYSVINRCTCNTKPQIDVIYYEDVFVVSCPKCNLKGPGAEHKDDAIYGWNIVLKKYTEGLSQDMKICPYCKSHRIIYGDRFHKCTKCGLKGPQKSIEKESLEAWNNLPRIELFYDNPVAREDSFILLNNDINEK